MALDHKVEEQGKAKKVVSAEQQVQREQKPLTMTDIQGKLDPTTVARMQQTMGNAAVQRMLVQRSESGEGEVADETASTINSRRGQGQALDSAMAQRAGETMGADLSGVKVHTDSTADQLNRDVGARAFTTGNDIFFREGEYNPNTSSGQHLIAHELTHVVQQGAAAPTVQAKMTVNDPNDKYEAEADAVADKVMSKQLETMQRQGQEEEELQMQALDEQPEDELQMQEVEEEELQMQEMGEQPEEELQLEEMPEEEEVQLQEVEEEELQLEEMPEEEDLQMQEMGEQSLEEEELME